jgi:hypothetical protein
MSLADWFNRNFTAAPPSEGSFVGGDRPSGPRPVLVHVNSAPSRDEFAAWRDDPVTQFVMRALEHNADECRREWLRVSWEGGNADQRQLDGLRERSDALLGFTADYEAFCETLGLEPEEEEQAA